MDQVFLPKKEDIRYQTVLREKDRQGRDGKRWRLKRRERRRPVNAIKSASSKPKLGGTKLM